MYFEVYRTSGWMGFVPFGKKWRWRLKSIDGTTLMQSNETFDDRSGCLSMITLLQSNRCHVVDADAGRVMRREGTEWVDAGNAESLLTASR
ncbi:DUF1508 domain-containing protein [Stenotrophomonas maltophilia]|uniref:DUF1508 domain-containing protein n=2 Tax=Stenotrophomonas maltophilia TaxID=40324 RepID=A0AA89WK92_STEMA|nr:DUF1508 domain-containing protein [Stenotrophomonas maltophilia]HDS1083294.1 DUF1508 domain-containing protein [Stenotrophomonas maltophilia]